LPEVGQERSGTKKGGGTAQAKKRMGKSNRRFETRRAVNRVRRPGREVQGNRTRYKRKFDDQIFGVAMETGIVELIRRPIRSQVRIGMMCHQGMDHVLRRDGQCKKGQQPAREDGSYDAMMPQAAI
jgi:hypothetical protein